MENKGIKYVEKNTIDNKDKQILSKLFENGRYSIADIANKTGIRRDSIIYRLKKMQENYIITGFQPIINPAALGYSNVATIMLKTKLISKEEKEHFINKLIKNSYILHIATTIGKYDFQLATVYKDTNQLNNIIEEIKMIIPDYVTEYEVLQIVEEPKFEDMQGFIQNLE